MHPLKINTIGRGNMDDFQEERVDDFGRIISGDRNDRDESRGFARQERSDSFNNDQGRRQSFGDDKFSPPIPRGGDRRQQHRGGDRGRGGGGGGGGYMGRGGRDDFDSRRIGGPPGQYMGRPDRYERGGPPEFDRFPPTSGNGPPLPFRGMPGMQQGSPFPHPRNHANQPPIMIYDPESNRLVPTRNNARINFMPPLMSYKRFITEQVDEYGPEVFTKRYEDFHKNYIEDFSNVFFHNHKSEEWFGERYNPVKIQEKETEMAEWSSSESSHFLEQLVSDPTEFIKLASLDKNADSHPDSLNYNHIQDHNKAVMVAGIRANCPKSIFKTAIIDALTAKGLALPNRIVISPPQWSTDVPIKFERCAWVIMPTVEAATGAEACLQDLKICVPVPFHLESTETEQDIMFFFHIQTQLFYREAAKPRLLPDHVSSPPRVLSDILRAQELAALFDKLRNVPEESSLKSILDASQHPEIASTFTKATQKLDIAVAYLRRVHFYSFYGANRYYDEAHLLSTRPVLHVRNIPCDLPVDGIAKVDASDESASKDSEAFKTSGKRKAEDSVDRDGDVEESADGEEARQGEHDQGPEDDQDEGGDKDPQETETREGETREGGEGAGKDDDVKQAPGVRAVRVGFSDRRIANMIKDLSKTLHARENATSSKDEADARILAEKIDNAIDAEITVLCPIEKEGKARCCYKSCNKLFTGPKFLKKHMATKHESFASDTILKITEPYMHHRYVTENIKSRPLPPVDVEALGGIEIRSVKEVLESVNKSTSRQSQGKSGGRDRDQHDRDRRQSGPPRPSHKPADSDKPLPSYMDIDAPKETVVSIDYGVSLPPSSKKRKIFKKS